MTTQVIVTSNLQDFRKALQRMSAQMRTRSVRRSTSAAAAVIQRQLKQAAAGKHSPKADQSTRTGTLARAIYRFRLSRDSTRGAERFLVGVRVGKKYARRRDGTMVLKPDAYYARWLEFGWIPRGRGQRRTGRRRMSASQRAAELTSSRRIAYPFIAAAFVASRSAAVEEFERRMNVEIDRLGQQR